MKYIRLTCLAGVVVILWPGSSRAQCPPQTTGPLQEVKLGLHAQAFNGSKACGANAPQQLGCDAPAYQSSLVTAWPLGERASVYVVALDICTELGLSGVTFGIDFVWDANTYEGIYINSFTSCATDVVASQSPDPVFPREPGSGVELGFSTCQQTADPGDPQGEAMAVLGWFDATAYYVPTSLAITPRLYQPTPDLTATTCTDELSVLCYPIWMGILAFGSQGGGYQPCVDFRHCYTEQGTPIPCPHVNHCAPIGIEPTTWSTIKRREK